MDARHRHRTSRRCPTCTSGIGATVGSVIPTEGAIIPAAVGVDIGCGMMAVETTLSAIAPARLAGAAAFAIEAAVPHGRTDNGGATIAARGATSAGATRASRGASSTREFARSPTSTRSSSQGNDVNHLGTLGTGNHFIEVCLDERERVWVMLHSGSRGVGNRIGSYFIELAKARHAPLVQQPARRGPRVPARGQRALRRLRRGGRVGAGLRADQPRADDGRRGQGARTEAAACRRSSSATWRSTATTTTSPRAALRARRVRHPQGRGARRLGDLGIIPGSMGARSFIVRGKGNPRASARAATAPAGRCRAARRSGASPSRITRRRRRASSAARTQGDGGT
jgi:tRNA-splicing ligase RtcB